MKKRLTGVLTAGEAAEGDLYIFRGTYNNKSLLAVFTRRGPHWWAFDSQRVWHQTGTLALVLDKESVWEAAQLGTELALLLYNVPLPVV